MAYLSEVHGYDNLHTRQPDGATAPEGARVSPETASGRGLEANVAGPHGIGKMVRYICFEDTKSH